jgi:EAL domain-containing protein (putative c-di-GMP-specific phosphodiesterase class I)
LIEMAHAFGKKTVAEFVESEDILTILKEFGIDYAQGYHIGRPEAME